MTINGWMQIFIFFVALILLVKPLGLFMAKIYQGESTFLSPILTPVEGSSTSGWNQTRR